MTDNKIWSSDGLKPLIDSLVECSDLSASVYDVDRKLIYRRFSTSQLIRHLSEKLGDKFIPKLDEFELESIKNTPANEQTYSLFINRMNVLIIPFYLMDELQGTIVLGPVFTRFPSPEDCQTIAKEFGDTYLGIWHLARGDQPSTMQKLERFGHLFQNVIESHLHGVLSSLKLEAADRMKDDLLSLVSHELRTPLSSALLRLQLMERQYKTESFEKMSEGLKAVQNSLRTQAMLIDDLLDVAKISQGELRYNFKTGDLKELLSNVHRQMEPLFLQRGLYFNLQMPVGAVRIKFDSTRLEQVVSNLLNNALKFTEKGGVELSLGKLSDRVRIAVSDTGVGISPADSPEIFKKFMQARTTKSHKGLGLGLYISDQIVRAHHGKIRVESEGKGKGTQFIMDLPKIF